MTKSTAILGKRLSNDSMNNQEYLLVCLAEECAKVIQRVTKALRFGTSECQPGQELTNEERLKYELTDLFTICHLLKDEGIDISFEPSEDKIKKVGNYMTYARLMGTLK